MTLLLCRLLLRQIPYLLIRSTTIYWFMRCRSSTICPLLRWIQLANFSTHSHITWLRLSWVRSLFYTHTLLWSQFFISCMWSWLILLKPTATSTRHVCQQCGKTGHFASWSYSHFDPSFQNEFARTPHALYFSPSLAMDEDQYLDTRASHHLTNEMNNLNLAYEEYSGTDHIHMAMVQVCQFLK